MKTIKSIPGKIRTLREKLDMSVYRMAKELRIPDHVLLKYERGIIFPSMETWCKIIDFAKLHGLEVRL